MPTLRATAYTDGAAQRLTDGYILLMLLVFPLFTGLQGYLVEALEHGYGSHHAGDFN